LKSWTNKNALLMKRWMQLKRSGNEETLSVTSA
jgi:hypothetical protein